MEETSIAGGGARTYAVQVVGLKRPRERWMRFRRPDPPRTFSFSLSPLRRFLRRLLLPVGYPESVRPEYFRYQVWDSVQGVCSYVRGVMTTRSVLQGAGVGSATSSATAAALVWVLKDGLGMVGSLGFAYLFADAFETNIKEWRLLADVLNNIALTLDLCLSLAPPAWNVGLTALSAVCKSCCWVCAGATKGRVSAHFAREGCLADVIAKEGTQETAVALLGMALGAACTHFVGTDAVSTWAIFLLLLALHQWSNYQLVRTLVLDTLNPQRCVLITQLLLEHEVAAGTDASAGEGGGADCRFPADSSPAAVATRESVYRPLWLAARGPVLGCSLDSLLTGLSAAAASDDGAAATLDALRRCWADEPFLIGFDTAARVVVALEQVPPPAKHLGMPHRRVNR